ncbi:HlyD family secretion protein [Rhizobium alvei]|uniref:HlyD family secretion protein n=1 Tax=Rhizobium alvei TaxID=1132659 RepID=A0ABT8YPA0_9HYPH|nr:HlyD family secretion protein [Rhizobium alvei]MDO6965444.1 HlyD family secretion protein [Rhizobium alvei]
MTKSPTNSVSLRRVESSSDGTSESATEMPAAASPAATSAEPVATSAAGASRRRPKLVLPVILLAALAGTGWYGYQWWTEGRFIVSTDDAYIEGDITNIAPKVTGYVRSVDVVANQHVKAGDPLVTLDDGDYRIAAAQAEAQISTQKLALKRFDAQINAAKATLAQANAQKAALEAVVRGAELTASRASELEAKSVGTVASRDNAQIALDQARANLAGAESSIGAAEANIAVVIAQRAEAESTIHSLELQLDKARRDLSFTVLKAPFDGVVGNLGVQAGDLVTPGQRLAALVPVEALYIEANFKETQIAHVSPGAKVRVHVDALDDEPLEGTVESISPASGAVFSLLPPENATGNFTKIIQRLPVRIALPKEALDSGRLRAGLSVVVDVDSRTGTNPVHVAKAD